MLADNESDFAILVSITRILIEDLNLVINADATSLPQSLDAVGDLTGLANASQFWCQGNVEHHISSFVGGLLSPFRIVNDILFEMLLDLQHVFFNLQICNLDLSRSEIALNLVICQLGQGILKFLAELLTKLLTAEFVICGNSVLDISILVLFVLNLHAVELLLDVSLESTVSIQNFLVRVNQLDRLKRILHRDVDLVAHESACFDSILHA